MAEKLDTEALTATIAGFLACQVLTLKYLVKEGAVDRDRFISFLEEARAAMAPGINDARSLLALDQVIASLRVEEGEVGVQ